MTNNTRKLLVYCRNTLNKQSSNVNSNLKLLRENLSKTFEDPAFIREDEKKVTILDEHGRIIGCVSAEEDITNLKLSQEKLMKHADDLKRTNELKLLFIDILHHDLLNPASVIKGYSEYLLETMGSSEERSIVEKIHSQNDRLIQIINTASVFGKLESTEMINFEELDLLELLLNVSREFVPLMEKKGMILECRAEGSYQAYANPIIEEAFSNLISNAIKFSPVGSRLIIDVLDGGSSWEITFTDFGPGISDEYKDVIFTRFKRVSSEETRGYGLGLSIVKKIVDLHGGQVGVYNNPLGIGSVFWIKIKKSRKMYDTLPSTSGHIFNKIEAYNL